MPPRSKQHKEEEKKKFTFGSIPYGFGFRYGYPPLKSFPLFLLLWNATVTIVFGICLWFVASVCESGRLVVAFALSSAVRPCVCFFGLWFLVVLHVFYCAISVPLVSGAGAVLIVLGFRIFRNRIPLACAEGKWIRSWICVADEAVDWNRIGMGRVTDFWIGMIWDMDKFGLRWTK